MRIQDLLNDFRIEFVEQGHHHCRPGWVQLRRCPFCSSNNYHLGFNLEGGFFACWRCGGHSIWDTLLAFDIPREKVKIVFRGIDTGPRPEKRERHQRRLKEPAGLGPLGPSHARYLRSRGFDLQAVDRFWKPRGIGLAARLGWRIYIPIVHRAETVSWTTRAIGPKVTPRYVSASPEEEAVPHKELVYGLDYCHHSVIIVEGPLDAWKVGPGAGALFGVVFTSAQVKQLVTIPRRFICFDSTSEAQDRAAALRERLVCFPGVTENWILDAKDPGCAGTKELNQMRRIAGLEIM